MNEWIFKIHLSFDLNAHNLIDLWVIFPKYTKKFKEKSKAPKRPYYAMSDSSTKNWYSSVKFDWAKETIFPFHSINR